MSVRYVCALCGGRFHDSLAWQRHEYDHSPAEWEALDALDEADDISGAT